MPTPLKPNQNIMIYHRQHKLNFEMKTLQMATDHYNIGYTLNGDRKCITHTKSYCYHKGDISVIAPYIYHKTTALTDVPYDSILIKFNYDFAKPFINEYGTCVFNSLYSKNVYRFDANMQEKLLIHLFDMLEIYDENEEHCEFILQGMLFRLFDMVLRYSIGTDDSEIFASPISENIIDALTYMETHYFESPSVTAAAETACLSTAYFSRLFHKQLGKTYSEYLDSIKIYHAVQLLQQTNKSIMEIATTVGYCHGNYLCERFKKIMGISPREWRKHNVSQ